MEGVSVQELLQAMIAGQSVPYRCLVADGHVVLLPDEPRWFRTVAGVDIQDLPRLVAARRYVEHLASLGEFEGLSVVAGGLLESSLFADRVSLTSQASVIEHLVQLLGDNPGVLFVVQRAPNGVEYLTMGCTTESPGDRPDD
jgi:hypothetical protein